MERAGWLILAILAAGVLDVLLILAWRQRKHGRPARATAIADQARSPRAVWPLAGLLAGAGLLLIGQGLETPLEGTGSYLARMLAVLGVAMVAVSGWRNRERRASSGPTPGEAVPIVGKALEHLAPRGWKTWSEEHPQQAWSSGTHAHKEFAKNSELTAGLVGSGLLLLVGRMISPVLLDWERAWVVIYTGLGLALFVFTAMGFTGRPLPRLIARPLGAIAGWLGVAPAQAVLLTVAPFISLVARLAAGDAVRMRHAGLAVIAWLTGIGLVVLGSGVKLTGRRERFRFSAESLGLGGLFLVALLVRGIGVAQAPWLFTGDEGSAGLTAVQFIDGFRDNLFAVGWFSFPSMFFFIQSLFIRAFGQTVQALRLLSALVGALTVVPTYFFAREVFGRRIAWASAIYLAAFHFHIHFSRIALNNIWDGFFTALFSAVFWRGWLRNQRGAFVAAGFALGLSQYFYVSVRVLVPLLALWLLAALIKNRSEFRARLPGLLTMTLAALVVALPLALFFVQNPEEFQAPLGRVAAHGAWIEAESELTGKSAVEIMWGQFKNAALGFTSVNLRLFYEPGQPMLLSLPATLFLMGLTLVVLRIRELTSIYVVLWVLAAIAVGGLSLSPPASQRYIFAAPAVAVLVAVPLVTAVDWNASVWPARRNLFMALSGLVLALAVWNDGRFYFSQYTPSKAFSDTNNEVAYRLAELLAKREGGIQVYFFGGRMGYRTHSSIPYLAPGAIGEDVLEPLTGPPEWPLFGDTIFILLPERADELGFVLQAYPDGEIFRLEGKNGPLFIGYEIRHP